MRVGPSVVKTVKTVLYLASERDIRVEKSNYHASGRIGMLRAERDDHGGA